MATFDSHKNFVTTSVLNSPGTSGTTLTVASLTGSIFPAAPFNCVVYPAGVFPTSLNSEIVRVTARTDDSLTIVRHQENSTARNIIAGDLISMTITAKSLTDIEAAVNSSSSSSYNLGSISGTVTLAVGNGNFQYSTMTNNITLNVSAGDVGDAIEFTTYNASGSNKTLSLASGISIPSNSSISFPKTIETHTSYILKLRYIQGAWCLISFIGGF